MPHFQEASARTGIPVDVLIAQARQESNFDPNARGSAGEIGIGQIKPSTAAAPGYGVTPLSAADLTDPRKNINFAADYLKALLPPGADPKDPAAIRAALLRYNGGGDPNYVNNVTRYLPAPGGGGTTVAAARPPAGAPAGSVVVAGPGAGTAAPAAAPIAEQPENQTLINRLTSLAPPPDATAPPAAPVAPAGGTAAPAVAAPPVVAPAAPVAPAPAQAPPAAMPPTGMASQQYQQARQLLGQAAQIEMLAAQNPRDIRGQATAKAMVADLKAKAALLMQADSVVKGPGGIQIHTLTGKEDSAAVPLADYKETSPGSGIWTGGPGTKPEFQPPGRLVIDKAGDVWRTTSAGAEKLSTLDPARVAALNAAESGGTAAGTANAKLVTQLAEQGAEAGRNIGNIDYGLSQLQKASAGGIPTGYFSSALANAASMAKSLGIDLSVLGVKPEAVGDIQTAQKTLAVISGAILQQAIGKGSSITDAKIEHFIHAQPGIQTDPQAVSRVLNWARAQYVYEAEMAKAGQKDASETGVLPMGWQAKYYSEHGFAPIYNPVTGHMEQPDGQAPGREAPKAVETAPVNPASRDTGKVYSTPKGPMKWTGTGWLPAQ